MPAYMLDTDISSYLMKRSNQAVLRRIQTVDPSEVCISSITQSELEYGVALSPRPQADRARLDEFLRHVLVVAYPGEAAAVYAQIRADLKARGCMIGGEDLLIAAHACSLGLILVTNNVREFSRVRDLKIENWAE
jgi:tRNA(fMet)-specific endonuclease VapC